MVERLGACRVICGLLAAISGLYAHGAEEPASDLRSFVVADDVRAVASAAMVDAEGARLMICYASADHCICRVDLVSSDGGMVATNKQSVYKTSEDSEFLPKWLHFSPSGKIQFLGTGLDMYQIDRGISVYWPKIWPSGSCDVVGYGGDACRTQGGVAGEPQLIGVSSRELRYAMDVLIDAKDARHRSHLRMGASKTFYVGGCVYALYREPSTEGLPSSPATYRWAVEDFSDVMGGGATAVVPPALSSVRMNPEYSALYGLKETKILLFVSVEVDKLVLATFSAGDAVWRKVSLTKEPPAYSPLRTSQGGFFSLRQGSAVWIGWPSGKELAVMSIDTVTLEVSVGAIADGVLDFKDWGYVWGGIVGEDLVVVRQGERRLAGGQSESIVAYWATREQLSKVMRDRGRLDPAVSLLGQAK